jgi:hypothetical protein
VQAFHSLGVLEYVAKFYHQTQGRRFVAFYASFLDYCERHANTLFGREYRTAVDYIATGYSGGGWNHADPGLAPILWPLEEATWLRCVRDSATLEREIRAFLDDLETGRSPATDPAILDDLVRFQVFLLSTMDHKEPAKARTMEYAWKRFLLDGCTHLGDLARVPSEYAWNNRVTTADPVEWCYKAVWVGRTQGNYKCHLEMLHERTPSIACVH